MANLGNLINLEKDLDKIAIIDEHTSVTYRQLHNMSNYVAELLRTEKGIKPGDTVGIKGVNTISYVAAYLGILKLGATVVLVNVKLPQTQIDYIIRDSGAKFLWENPSVPTDVIVNFESAQVNDNDPAIIMYTSGSTSQPKGVVLPHRHRWIIEQKSNWKGADARRMIVAAPLYHMNGLSNTESALISHATLVLLEKFDSKKFLENVSRHRVTTITSVPTMLTMLLQETELISNLDLSCVNVVAMASSPVSKSLWASLKQTFPKALLINAYGMTEVSPGMFGRHPKLPTPEMSVGYPIPGIDYRIVDGVLQVRSPSMLLKYNNVALNNLTEDGYFITNDLFKVDENGFYFFLGRADDMFVSGGHNIYPRQIESILEEHQTVKTAAVVGLDDEIKGVKPYAFVVSDAGEEELKEFMLTRLPHSHCPRRIWAVKEIPLNAVNKVNKTVLKEWAEERTKNDI